MGAALPPLYQGWVNELLDGSIPDEREATCDDCAMLSRPGEQAAGSGFSFDPACKCCTYVPDLPNFLIGRILADADPEFAEGRATLERRLGDRIAMTPLGLGRSPTYQLLYHHSASLNAFGRNRDLTCPHYLQRDGGRCGIWKHRKSTCATWFCKFVRGATGSRFWRTMHQLLDLLETDLARWCVLQLDPGPRALRRLFPPLGGDPDQGGSAEEGALDGRVDDAVHRETWGDWVGREREFFIESGKRVAALDWDEVLTICGPETEVAARIVRQAHVELLSEAVPPRLVAAPFKVGGISADAHRIWSYSAIDPLELPRPLLDVLHQFDGRPTDEALRRIAEQQGVELDDGLVRRLADFRILVPLD